MLETMYGIIIILVVFISFLLGYNFRRRQEEKIKREIWLNAIKHLRLVHGGPYSPKKIEKNDNFKIIDNVMDEYYRDWSESDIQKLKDDLKIALLEEDYEKAAQIRDLLNRLES